MTWPPGLAVEVAGRLVGENELRAPARARARWRRAAARRPKAAPGNDRRAGRGRPRAAARAPSRRRWPRRRTPAAAPRSPAPSWSARDGTTGTRCRSRRRASAPARPRSSAERSCPATATLPLVARSRPAITISSEVLPEPDGPTMASDCPSLGHRGPRRAGCSTGPARLVSVRRTSSSTTIGLVHGA